MARSRVLVTGAAGGIGGVIRPFLRESYDLRLFDLRAPEEANGDEIRVGDITDAAAVAEAMDGIDAVVHLAGNRMSTATWDELTGPNLVGQHRILAAAADAGVRRVVLASSCHASGRYDVDRVAHVDPRWPARPCCPYGATKDYGEAAGRLIADTTDTSVIALRIGAAAAKPYAPIYVPFWLSLPDLCGFIGAAVTADVRYGVYYAGSANARERWNLQLSADELGYTPQDDSAEHLDAVDYALDGPNCYSGAY
jgi:nucleoside-diphosphate-sugar epimerase